MVKGEKLLRTRRRNSRESERRMREIFVGEKDIGLRSFFRLSIGLLKAPNLEEWFILNIFLDLKRKGLGVLEPQHFF